MLQVLVKTSRVLFIVVILSSMLLSACEEDKKDESTQEKTIGVLNLSPGMESVLAGFKATMTERGYEEGKNITYIYQGPAGSVEGLDPLIEELKTHDLDLVLAFGTPTAQKAQAAFADTDIPVLFGPVNDPITAGLVTSITTHSENVSGVQNGASVAKGLEWLSKIMPEAKNVYVPHNPDDASSIASLLSLQEIAPSLDIELLINEVTTNDELTTALAEIPEDADAVFILRVAMFDARTADFVPPANALGIPVMASRSDILEATDVIIGFGPDFYKIGQQAAGLAVQILEGTKASDLPIETSEEYLSINLKAAEAIGIEMPNEILNQANEIIR
ncbi:MAG: ABC transporter substrate-binding protein [Anaerolineae bacterium]|nr:ABC transporter substrate-binding protein [Anaerolineae bacterium]